VRPFGIEFLNKVVEAGLLLQTVHSGRSGCFFPQCEMHALVAAVLLWVARLDALDGDAEPQPPHREFGEIVFSARRDKPPGAPSPSAICGCAWLNIALAIRRITGAISDTYCMLSRENSIPNFVTAEHSSYGIV
jgi:hypothetical protein